MKKTKSVRTSWPRPWLFAGSLAAIGGLGLLIGSTWLGPADPSATPVLAGSSGEHQSVEPPAVGPEGDRPEASAKPKPPRPSPAPKLDRPGEQEPAKGTAPGKRPPRGPTKGSPESSPAKKPPAPRSAGKFG